MLDISQPTFVPTTQANVMIGDAGAPGSSFGGTLLAPGTIPANRYEIVQILGEGGMGAVHKARNMELEREVALKVIRPEMANHPEILQLCLAALSK